MNQNGTEMKAFASASVRGSNGWLRVNASSDASQPVEMLIIGQIGKSWWDDSGVDEKEFRDALAQIPKGRKITIGINSEGGSVQDGLGIYNAIRERKEDVTCRIDGYAVSIASVIALAGGKTVSPRTSVWMIHDPWTFAQGNADEMRKCAAMLEAHAETLLAAYQTKTGKTSDEIRAAMKEETWFSGEQARAWGLADEISEEKADLASASFDPARFKRPPASLLSAWNSRRAVAAAGEVNNAATNAAQQEEKMNRKAILALLEQHGVKIASDATDEVLLAQLDGLVKNGKVNAEQRDSLTADIATINARVDGLIAQNKKLEAERNAERKTRHERSVDDAIAAYRIDASEREEWVALFGENEARASKMLAARQANPPGMPPVVTVASDSPSDLTKAVHRARAPIQSWVSGNRVSAEARAAAAKDVQRIITANREKLVYAASTNTIDSDLQRTVILSDMLRAFQRRLINLGIFSTVYSNIPLRTEGGTAKVAVPYFPLSTTASTNFVAGNGYDTEVDTEDGAKDLTLNKRKYQRFSYSSETMSRQPYFNVAQHLVMKGEQLAVDVWTDVLSVVTNANFGAAVFTGLAAAFDIEDVIDLRTKANQADWPDVGRSLALDATYEGALLKVQNILSVQDSGSTEAIRDGSVSRLAGFGIVPSPRIPANAENLVGFITMPSAVLCATAPIEPSEGVRNLLVSYDLVMDPQTGIGFSYRHGGNDTLDRDYHVIECAYGYTAGETAALKRLVSA